MKLRLVVVALLVLIAALSIWFAATTSRQNDRIALLEKQLQSAQSHTPQPATAAPAAENPEPPGTSAREPRPAQHVPTPAQTCPDVETPNARLQEANAALSRVQARVVELEAQVEELSREKTRIAMAESESQAKLADLQHNLETLNGDRAALDRRMKDIETENGKLRQQTLATTQKNSDFAKLVTEFQDVSRRQQIYVTNILRRYRELTDLLRSLPGMIETKGNGPELARIQSAVSMADEDLKQLNDLNARLTRVQRQLTTAKP